VRRRRLALWVWYRGDGFQGWQSQRTRLSVQETLEAALAAQGVEDVPWAPDAPTAGSTPAASR
jgi:tRNA U38,U39,U40 pseudouridine synthase TruA